MSPLEQVLSKSFPFNPRGHNYDLMNVHNRINYKEEIEFFNCSMKKVMIRRRDGRLIPLLSGINGSASYPAVVVRVKVLVHHSEASEMFDILSTIDAARTSDYAEVLYLMNELSIKMNQPLGGHRHHYEINLEYTIQIDDLEKAGGALYVPELDMVFQITNKPHEMYHHPFSKEVSYLKTLTGLSTNNFTTVKTAHAAGVFYYIVDNLSLYGDRYTSIDGVPITITAMKDSIKPDGVYKVITNRSVSGLKQKTIEEYYSFEDAEKHLKIYKTFQQAFNHNENEKAEYETKNKELERIINEQKESIAIQRITHDKEMLEAKQAFDQIKHANDLERLNLEHADRKLAMANTREADRLATEKSLFKDELERKQLKRKDRSDNWKFISTLIMTMLTAGISLSKVYPLLKKNDG